jgi:hypothetical protein
LHFFIINWYEFQPEAPMDISPVSLSEVDTSQQSVQTVEQINEDLARLLPMVADGTNGPLQSETAAVQEQVEETPPVAKKRAHESIVEPKAAENKSSSLANPL